jgi:hypothetical protein
VLDPRFGISYYKRDTGVNADSYEEIYAVVDSMYKSFYAPINAEVPSVVVDEYDLFDNEPAVDELKDYCNNSIRLNGGQIKIYYFGGRPIRKSILIFREWQGII